MSMSNYYQSAEYFEQEMQVAQCELSHYQDMATEQMQRNQEIKRELTFANFKLENIKRIINSFPKSNVGELIKVWTED